MKGPRYLKRIHSRLPEECEPLHMDCLDCYEPCQSSTLHMTKQACAWMHHACPFVSWVCHGLAGIPYLEATMKRGTGRAERKLCYHLLLFFCEALSSSLRGALRHGETGGRTT